MKINTVIFKTAIVLLSRRISMANMKDIADKANVSIATVSKVLNGIGNISNETTELVMSIAKELNYRPNLYARNLKKGQSRAIGIISEDITVFNTPPIIDGIGACCEKRNYHYLLENLRLDKLHIDPIIHAEKYNQLTNEAIDLMLSMQVDGIIYLSCHSHKVLAHPLNQNIPFVCAYCTSPTLSIPSILYDDRKAAFEATSLLIRQGHTKIGSVTGYADSIHMRNRLTGYQEALFEHSIPYNPHLTVQGDWDRDSGYQAAQQLLKEKVTAVFCHNDLMAMGVMDYCVKQGIEIGKDLALIGFDNRDISTVCRPALSTVELPLFDIGHTSTDILIDKIEGIKNPAIGEIYLDCQIIERESTKMTR